MEAPVHPVRPRTLVPLVLRLTNRFPAARILKWTRKTSIFLKPYPILLVFPGLDLRLDPWKRMVASSECDRSVRYSPEYVSLLQGMQYRLSEIRVHAEFAVHLSILSRRRNGEWFS